MVSLCIAASSILHHSRGPSEPVQIGDFVSVNAYVLQLFTPLSFLGTIYSTVIQAFIDMSNLSELLLTSPDVLDKPRAQPLQLADAHRGAKIEFQSVDFSYPTQQSRGLRSLSFTTPAGSTTAVVGPTGAGKSTISRLLFRFYDVSKGRVLVDDQDVARITQSSLRHAIGVVPQDTVLFNCDVRTNVLYGKPGASQEEIEAAARGAQILPFIEGLEQGWDTVVGERGLRLSGGEKQRVSIARCLLKNPPIVLLDEATSALDSATEAAVQSALEKLGSGRTQLVVAHRLSTIAGAPQILVLDQGRLVERGTHGELLETGGLYHGLWTAQQEALVGAPAAEPQ
jgi:ABC-type transport system involved in Fe-S cluster assembly fused permease/ATPase subunit